jgi:hypothetical protein
VANPISIPIQPCTTEQRAGGPLRIAPSNKVISELPHNPHARQGNFTNNTSDDAASVDDDNNGDASGIGNSGGASGVDNNDDASNMLE